MLTLLSSEPKSLYFKWSQTVFETRAPRSETRYEKRAITKSFKMKLVIVVVFIAIYLAAGVHSAPIAYSISSDKLTLEIPIEDVWDGLSKGKKNW